jgi:hypothetical protein
MFPLLYALECWSERLGMDLFAESSSIFLEALVFLVVFALVNCNFALWLDLLDSKAAF